jgi:hypothetical protein
LRSNADETAQKKKKTFCKCVSEYNFATISKAWESQVVEIVVPYGTVLLYMVYNIYPVYSFDCGSKIHEIFDKNNVQMELSSSVTE